MTLTKSRRIGNVSPMGGVTPDILTVEPGANEGESVRFMVGQSGLESADWEYSDAAEDNGTAGILDGNPGFIYRGVRDQANVKLAGLDLTDKVGATTEAGDTATVGLYKNSTLIAAADEGWNTHETTVEYNADAVMELNEGDVIRAGVLFSGEEADADLSITYGATLNID